MSNDTDGDTDADADARRPPVRPWLHLGLYFATLATTTAQGAAYVHGDGTIFPLADGLAYSLPLLAILTCHEFGHYFAARIHGVPATLPYFIPLPPGVGLLGTMGAVIAQAGTTDRRKLIDIGAAGPLAGLAVAIPVLIVGLSLSEVRPLVGLGTQEGNSILYALVKFAVKGEWLPGGGRDVILHPTAWAGWAGLLVTMLNLIPIGQLDGGHIATAYFGNRYSGVARRLHRALPLLGAAVFAWVYVAVRRDLSVLSPAVAQAVPASAIALQAAMPWLVWFLLLGLLRRLSRGEYHPRVDERELPPGRAALFWVVCVTFALIFMPVPLRTSIGSAGPPVPDVPDVPPRAPSVPSSGGNP